MIFLVFYCGSLRKDETKLSLISNVSGKTGVLARKGFSRGRRNFLILRVVGSEGEVGDPPLPSWNDISFRSRTRHMSMSAKNAYKQSLAKRRFRSCSFREKAKGLWCEHVF